MSERKRRTIARRMTPEELKAFRRKHGLSQRDLAELLGVGSGTVADWETGRNRIPKYLHFILSCLEKEKIL